jgi:DNA-binding transcriptional ArsR family regulator
MGSSGERWINDAAGPVIRPYALVGGRTQPAGGGFNLIAMVAAVRGTTADPSSLEPEHLLVLRICRRPTSVADIAAELSLPLGVVRIILADLREQGLVMIRRPVPPAQLPNIEILRRVANGLRRL